MRTYLFALFALGPVLLPNMAAAAPEDANAQIRGRGVDVMGQSSLAALRSARSATMDGGLDVGLAAYFRLGPRLSVGATGTRTWMTHSSTAELSMDGKLRAGEAASLFRGGGAVRYDYALLGPFAAWVSGEVGLAFARDRFTATNPDLSSRSMSDTRIAPWLGFSTGAELRPVRYVSIGLHAGALHAAFGAPAGGGSSVPGPMQSLFAGLDLGVHLPME